jgi:energy-coupling factor transporter ATP-binding protein EcfA2
MIQATNPEFRKHIYSLSSIQIRNSWINDALSIKEQTLPLNRNLVAVTGGKGSGKTALLDLIANCFQDRCKREGEDNNSFVQRIEDQRPNLAIEIGFIGEEIPYFSKELTSDSFFRDSKITYLPQGMIEEYCGDQSKLDRMIQEIIFNNKEVKERDYKKQFDLLRDQISKLVKEINEINVEVYGLEEETTKEIESEIENKIRIKEGELKNKQDELKKLTENIPESIKENILILQEAEKNLVTTHSKLSNIKTGLEQLEEDLRNFFDSSNKTINELNNRLSELSIGLTIPKLDFKPQFDLIQEKLPKLILQKAENIAKQIEEKGNQLSQLSGVESTHIKLLEEINEIKVDLNGLGIQLKELIEKKAGIKSLDDLRIKKYQALINNHLEWKEYYKEVMKTFSIGKSAIMGDIDFESIIVFIKDRFIELGSDIFDQRRISTIEIEKVGDNLENIIVENPQEMPIEKIQEFIENISKKKKLLKATRSSYDFYKWIFGNYFSLSTKILFKDRIMDKLSLGQKGTVLLKLFLAEGDYPLVIDQPEESLDNKFIYDELVGAFREAKKKRQIIIATNNANLVVNTDAEQIIVADFENNIISYNSGTLENLEMRKDIMPILEGSEEAFRKRGEKYGI